MTFRDDRDALRHKAEELQGDLNRAERELAEHRERGDRVKRLEAELAAAREQIERIEAALRDDQGTRAPSSGATSTAKIAASVLLVALACGGGAAFLLARPDPPRTEKGLGNRPQVALPAIEPSASQAPAEISPLPATPVRKVEAAWTGRVVQARGIELAPGAKCTLSATLQSSTERELTIACGTKVLYRSTDHLEGMSSSRFGTIELPAEESGKTELGLLWEDQGTRTGERAQASVNTPQRAAAAWRDTMPSYRVEMEVDELSAPVIGALEEEHTEAALAFRDRIRRNGRVTKVTGPAPIAAGASCEVRVLPAWGTPYECRAQVRCGQTTLYGGATKGFAHCAVEAGSPIRFQDEELKDDPRLDIDLGTGQVGLEARRGEETYRVAIELAAGSGPPAGRR